MCVRCDAPVYIIKSQMCKRCYMALWRAKNYKPSERVLATPYERFIAKVEKTETCWLWQGWRCAKGYGRFNGTTAHRFSYQHYKRPIPPNWQIDHLCKITSCVNPDHLEAVTMEENLRRQHGDRYLNPLCPHGHEKSWVNGKLRCYECQSVYKKNKRHADAKK
jgi:hypothetical protein